MTITRTALAALMLATIGSPALAQDDENAVPTRPADSLAQPPYQPEWSSSEIAQVAKHLAGTWRTQEPIDSMPDADGQSVPVYLAMSVAPVQVTGLADTLYVETARTDTPWSPYRRAIFQIYPYRDGLRLRTYELAVGQAAEGAFNGMHAATEHFPDLGAEDLIATIDLDLTLQPSGFTGQTPYPFPTGLGGAVEMTSTLSIDGDALSVADRGYNAQGEIVWGAEEDGVYFFERGNGLVSTDRRDDGMVILDYGGASGPIVANGDQMHVHYEGFLASGARFDSSYDRNQPFVFAYPPGARAIAGWGLGMDGMAVGARRKLIIPGHLGYGPGGNPRANIPGDATLYFNIHLVHLDRPQAGGAQPDHADHDDHTGHDH